MQTLISYEHVPENIEFYLVPTWEDWMQACQGRYIGESNLPVEVEKACIRLGDYLCPDLDLCADKNDIRATTWAQYKVEDITTLVMEGPTRLVSTGFLM